MQQTSNQQPELIEASEYLTPHQRSEVIADILATIALRILKAEHDQE